MARENKQIEKSPLQLFSRKKERKFEVYNPEEQRGGGELQL